MYFFINFLYFGFFRVISLGLSILEIVMFILKLLLIYVILTLYIFILVVMELSIISIRFVWIFVGLMCKALFS